MHLHEEAREAGWTDEQLLEAIAYVALECFTAMVNVAGEVPVDGSVEDTRVAARRVALRGPRRDRDRESRVASASEPPARAAARSTTRRSS